MVVFVALVVVGLATMAYGVGRGVIAERRARRTPPADPPDRATFTLAA